MSAPSRPGASPTSDPGATTGHADVRQEVVVVTGLSGAGKSTALHALEDLGFFCVDNLPTALAPQAVELCERGGMMRVALGMDVRVRAFLGQIGPMLAKLENDGSRSVHVVFFDASDETLLRRFSETRRPHPLNAGGDGALAVLDGVGIERERLAPLRARATRVFDTTNRSVHELRRDVIAHFGPASGGAPRMVTRILSFGFKFGTPVDADLVLDVRFLDNPYFVPSLKELPGTDPLVRDFVLGMAEAQEFLARTRDLLRFVLPRYEREGKSYLTIGVGCTGGRHRSVVVAESLAMALSHELGMRLTVAHRDVERGQNAASESSPTLPEPRSQPVDVELTGLSTPPPAPSVAAHAPAAGRSIAAPKDARGTR